LKLCPSQKCQTCLNGSPAAPLSDNHHFLQDLPLHCTRDPVTPFILMQLAAVHCNK
jgi:hypothetical protein